MNHRNLFPINLSSGKSRLSKTRAILIRPQHPISPRKYMQVGMVSTLGGGVGKFTNRLIEGLLKKEDIQIGLFLTDNRHQYNLDSHNRVSIRNSPIGSPLLSKLMTIFELSIKKLPFDLVHCHYSSNAAFLRRYKGNVILTMHGFPRPEVEARMLDKIAYSFEQWCISALPKGAEIITVSEYAKNNIKQRYGLDAKVIYLGIDCSTYHPAANRDAIKRILGFQNKKVILFVGRLHPIKDPITLVNAYYEVTKRVTDSVLVIVGKGALKEKILKLCSEYGISIKIIDSLDDKGLIPLYQCSDLFILPSVGEAAGAVVVEAMACGCPCVANTSGGPPELLGMKELLVEPCNPKALAQMMIYLLENPHQSQKVSEYLYERANKLFSLDRMAGEYYQLYCSVVNR